jgi:hypothetical protein
MVATSAQAEAPPQAESEAEDGSSSLELTLGVGRAAVGSRDQKGSPLAYRGTGIPPVIKGRWLAENWSAGFGVSALVTGFNAAPLRADRAQGADELHRADPVFVDFSIWGQHLMATPEPFQIALGAQLSHWTFFRSYEYNPSQIGGVETWDATLTADARAQLSFTHGRWEAHTGASFALAGRMMRPSHAIRGDERLQLIQERRRIWSSGQWATVARFQKMQIDAQVRFDFNSRVGAVAGYRLGMMSFHDDQATRAYHQQGMAGVVIRFR